MRTTGTGRLPALALAFLAGTALGTAACGGSEAEDPPAVSSAPSATPDAEAEIEAAYRGYEDAFAALGASGDPDPARLRPYATAALAQKDAEHLSLIFDEGNRLIADLGIDVRSITVTADAATLTACLDASRWATVKAGSTPGPEETGFGQRLTDVRLVLEDETWRVSGKKPVGPC
jgi:hypothetical protein